jgi:hypothetical protein
VVISIFSDKRFLPSGFECHMLLPFWGQRKDPSDPDADRFDRWMAKGPEIFRMESLLAADIAVYPAPPTRDPRAFKEFQEVTVPKPLVVFFNDDSDAAWMLLGCNTGKAQIKVFRPLNQTLCLVQNIAALKFKRCIVTFLVVKLMPLVLLIG